MFVCLLVFAVVNSIYSGPSESFKRIELTNYGISFYDVQWDIEVYEHMEFF